MVRAMADWPQWSGQWQIGHNGQDNGRLTTMVRAMADWPQWSGQWQIDHNGQGKCRLTTFTDFSLWKTVEKSEQ